MTTKSLSIGSSTTQHKCCCGPIHDAVEAGVSWSGRSICLVRDGLAALSSRVASAGHFTLNTAGSLVSDTNQLATVLRRLNDQVFDAIEQWKGIPEYFSKFKASSIPFVGVIDTLQVAGDAKYFYDREYLAESSINVMARLSAAMANIGSTLLWLEEVGALKLEKMGTALGQVRLFKYVPSVVSSIPGVRNVSMINQAAAALGNVRVFGFCTYISMGAFATGAASVYYFLRSVDSINLLTTDIQASEKVQAGLNLSFYASELMLSAMLTIGGAGVFVLGAAGASCIITSVASFAYKQYK